VEKSLEKFEQEVRVDITFEPEWTLSEDLKISLGLA
jgi:metal-sulfur cluster biosynthetic enzyme